MDQNIEARKAVVIKAIKDRLFLDVATLYCNNSYIPDEEPDRFIVDVIKLAQIVVKYNLMAESDRKRVQDFLLKPLFGDAEPTLELIYKNYRPE